MSRIVDLLDADWHRTINSPTGRRFTRRLSTNPAIGPNVAANLLHVMRTGGPNPADTDVIYTELLRLGPTEPLAQRTILQALLPGLCSIIGRAANQEKGTTPDDHADEIISLAALHIATFPVTTRPTRIPANLILDISRAFIRERRTRFGPIGRVDTQPDPDERLPDPSAIAAHERAEHRHQLVTILHDAQRRGIVSHADTHILIATRILGIPMPEVAAQVGLTPDHTRRVRHRTEHRLHTWTLRTTRTDDHPTPTTRCSASGELVSRARAA